MYAIKGGDDMKIQEIKFAIITDGREVTQIGRSVIYQPQADYKGKGTKWLDDARLVRKGGAR